MLLSTIPRALSDGSLIPDGDPKFKGICERKIAEILEKTHSQTGNASLFHDLGLCYDRLRKFHQSVEAYAKAYKLMPNDEVFAANYATALATVGVTTKNPEPLRQSFSIFQSALSIEQSADTQLNYGMALFEYYRLTGDRAVLESASEALDQALSLEPYHFAANNTKGALLSDIANATKQLWYYDEAIAAFDKALMGNGSRYFVLANKAACVLHKAMHTSDKDLMMASLRMSDEVLQSDPLDYLALHNKGQAQYKIAVLTSNDDYLNEALATLSSCHAVLPESPTVLLNLGNVLVHSGIRSRSHKKVDEGIDCFSRARALDPDGSVYSLNTALAYRLLEDYFGEDHGEMIIRNYCAVLATGKNSCSEVTAAFAYIGKRYDMPRLLNRLVLLYPHLSCYISEVLGLAEAMQYSRNDRNLLQAAVKEEAARGKQNSDSLLWRALLAFIGGDPIESFYIHDELLDRTIESNLCHQYYYILAAEAILSPEVAAIKQFAVKGAERVQLSGADHSQLYYAGCILQLENRIEDAARIFSSLPSDHPKAPFRLLECYYDLANEEQFELLARTLASRGTLSLYIKQIDPHRALDTLLNRIDHFETYRGWFLATRFGETVLEGMDRQKIPRSRSVFGRDSKLMSFPDPKIGEMPLVDAALTLQLDRFCKSKMSDIYGWFMSDHDWTSRVEELAERLLVEMLREHDLRGSVVFADHNNLLLLGLAKGSLSEHAYTLVSTFLCLKCKAINKGHLGGRREAIGIYIVKEVYGVAVRVLGHVLPNLPVSVLLQLIQQQSSKEKILAMNFKYFRESFQAIEQREGPAFHDIPILGEVAEFAGLFA